MTEESGARWVAIRRATGRGDGYWEFADSMEAAPFRIKGADVDAILAEPRFRAFTIWYLSDPRPPGPQMCLWLEIRHMIHSAL